MVEDHIQFIRARTRVQKAYDQTNVYFRNHTVTPAVIGVGIWVIIISPKPPAG
jgi:hypothetical protein